nr:N-acetylmuramoyl-L-alanine amidase-like domain-containing protein [uncultured Moellerella sp.]
MKKIKPFYSLLIMLAIVFPIWGNAQEMKLDDDSKNKLNIIFADSNIKNNNRDAKIKKISSYFIDTPYNSNILDQNRFFKEILTANLTAVDCLTFIEYVEAIKRSENLASFKTNLINIRYFDQTVSYAKRKHFFTDWTLDNNQIQDITAEISANSVSVSKQINKKTESDVYIRGLPITKRNIQYIPVDKVDDNLLSALQTGDYVGIYSNKIGLDVSHVGIIIRDKETIYYRNASSLKKHLKVIDTPFLQYIQGKKGIIIYRAN